MKNRPVLLRPPNTKKSQFLSHIIRVVQDGYLAIMIICLLHQVGILITKWALDWNKMSLNFVANAKYVLIKSIFHSNSKSWENLDLL